MEKKIHITLEKSFFNDQNARQSVKSQVIEAVGLRNVNEKRLERYGILTGTVDSHQDINPLRNVRGVGDVSEDSTKNAV